MHRTPSVARIERANAYPSGEPIDHCFLGLPEMPDEIGMLRLAPRPSAREPLGALGGPGA